MKKIIFSLTGLTISLLSAAQVVTFNYSDSIKSYTIPACVDSVKIEVKGAQGGYSNFSGGQTGGLGADIIGTFTVTPGEVLNILAGGMGILTSPGSGGMQLNGGGGGGSFVWKYSDSTLLITAGGGGGANSCAITPGGIGLATLGGSGLGGISYCGGSCDNGNGVGGGGAGWLGNGAASCGLSNATCSIFAYTPLNSGAGGIPCAAISPYSGGAGGFGGGGAGDGNCGGGGGGGGYTGGNAGGNTIIGGCSSNGSQGGTSYNIGTGQTNTAGTNSGAGVVIITVYTNNVSATPITINSILCNGGNTGSAAANPACGTMPYTYNWSPSGGSSDTASGLTAGTYTITVTDKNSITTTASVTITQPAELTITSISASPDTICTGQCATIKVNSSGGTPAYSYSWSNGATTDSINVCPVLTKTYTVIITDANGCTHDSTIKVVVNVCAGINEVSALDEQVKFYPNPFSQSVNVDISISGPVNLTMFNMIGQKVGSWQMDKGLNTINTSKMPSGVYTIEVKTINGVLNKKLVKIN